MDANTIIMSHIGFPMNKYNIFNYCIGSNIQKPLANRVALQMVEAAPQNQEVLGYLRKRCVEQIYVTFYTYCHVAIVQLDMNLERSTYEVLRY